MMKSKMKMEIIRKSSMQKKESKANEVDTNGKLRVAAYARVSTNMEDQQTSFISQQKYYYDKITKNANWIMVGVYADEAISGTSDKKRKNFMKMIFDALNGEIDLIFTKSISRFARNTLDTIKYVRMLKEKNVAVYFEEENINTLDMIGELLLTILSSIAQQEVNNTSSHLKKSFEMKMKSGKLVGQYECFGYKYDPKINNLVIQEDEAKIIRIIFKMALEGKNNGEIKRYLEKNEYRYSDGTTIWPTYRIASFQKNIKYSGDILQGQYYVNNTLEHKTVKNYGEKDMYYVKNHHPAIIDRADFYKLQEILKKRSETYAIKNNYSSIRRFALSGKTYCGFCGNYRKRRYLNSKEYGYICNLNLEGNRFSCPESSNISADFIEQSFVRTMHKLKKHILNENLFSDKVNSKLEYTREFVRKVELTDKFDGELFKKIINYVIIGGFNEDGSVNPFKMRFILKTNEDFYTDCDKSKDHILNPKSFTSILEYTYKGNILYKKLSKDRKWQFYKLDEVPTSVEIDMK